MLSSFSVNFQIIRINVGWSRGRRNPFDRKLRIDALESDIKVKPQWFVAIPHIFSRRRFFDWNWLKSKSLPVRGNRWDIADNSPEV